MIFFTLICNLVFMLSISTSYMTLYSAEQNTQIELQLSNMPLEIKYEFILKNIDNAENVRSAAQELKNMRNISLDFKDLIDTRIVTLINYLATSYQTAPLEIALLLQKINKVSDFISYQLNNFENLVKNFTYYKPTERATKAAYWLKYGVEQQQDALVENILNLTKRFPEDITLAKIEAALSPYSLGMLMSYAAGLNSEPIFFRLFDATEKLEAPQSIFPTYLQWALYTAIERNKIALLPLIITYAIQHNDESILSDAFTSLRLSPLGFAITKATQRNIEIIELLINNGALLTNQDTSGRNGLDYLKLLSAAESKILLDNLDKDSIDNQVYPRLVKILTQNISKK
ncbi:hypothetical protein J120_00285 [candidate division TM6 bacterium JCVI TM6SC1]|uniref:Uncharacterized protein n=1 Tax=candidate division TM6 bacterium JCVI TM6SC1 TaxID=1306947 RepID=A0A0D2I2I7_9BACT|nr:hypothetical protein J120_00285 [candidate division TM6 bacterium JCVI TM6SC1]